MTQLPKKVLSLIILTLASFALIIGVTRTPVFSASVNSADTIYLGGNILTMNGDVPTYAEAVAVKDGKIVFVGDVHIKNIGREKADFISPIKAAKEQGFVFSNHTDFNVTPLDPFFVIWTAMARESRSGEVLGADQRVDAYTALQGLTTGPAWQIFEENRKGRIKEGLLADFVVLSADPVQTDVSQIRNLKVLETIKEDKPIYQAETVSGNVNYHPL